LFSPIFFAAIAKHQDGHMTNEWRGKWALVTGASAGIGQAIARELAAGGTNLILTARRLERLEQFAAELRVKSQVNCAVIPADLTQPEAPGQILEFTAEKSLPVDLLINNAGFGQYGEVPMVESHRLLEMIQVNCSAMVHLTRLFLPQMIARRHGDILILASTASFQAVPYISVYAATKAFDLFFAEGLAEEMRPHGIRVCALCPGSTESEFHQVAGQDHLKFAEKHRETAEKVARVGLAALAAGKSAVISGGANTFNVIAQRLVPRRFVTRIAGKMFRPTN
jgi:short-subunit dehydrogenase